MRLHWYPSTNPQKVRLALEEFAAVGAQQAAAEVDEVVRLLPHVQHRPVQRWLRHQPPRVAAVAVVPVILEEFQAVKPLPVMQLCRTRMEVQ